MYKWHTATSFISVLFLFFFHQSNLFTRLPFRLLPRPLPYLTIWWFVICEKRLHNVHVTRSFIWISNSVLSVDWLSWTPVGNHQSKETWHVVRTDIQWNKWIEPKMKITEIHLAIFNCTTKQCGTCRFILVFFFVHIAIRRYVHLYLSIKNRSQFWVFCD